MRIPFKSAAPLTLALAVLFAPTVPVRAAPADEARVRAVLAAAGPNGEMGPNDREIVEDAVNAVVAEIVGLATPKTPSKAFDEVLRKIDAMLPGPARYGQPGTASPLVYRLLAAKDFSVHFQDFLSAEERGDFARAGAALEALTREPGQVFPILPRSELLGLQESTAAQAATRRKAVVESVTGHLAGILETAKSAADLDPVIAEIEAAQDTASVHDSALAQSLQGLRRYTSLWQDYFIELAANPETAARTLKRLAQESSPYSVALRTAVAARISKAPAGSAHEARPSTGPDTLPDPNALTVENLDDYAARLDMRRLGGQGTQELSAAGSLIGQLCAARDSLANGDPQRAYEVYSHPPARGAYEVPTSRIREILASRALEAQFKDTGLAHEPPEKASEFIKRIIDAQIQAKNWQGAVTALQVGGMLVRSGEYAMEASAFRFLVVGIREEDAGEYSMAVSSYLQCLATPGQDIPVAELGDRLKAIKSAHPKDYADGHLANTLHQQAYGPARQGMVPSPPGAPGQASTGVPVTPTPVPTSK